MALNSVAVGVVRVGVAEVVGGFFRFRVRLGGGGCVCSAAELDDRVCGMTRAR